MRIIIHGCFPGWLILAKADFHISMYDYDIDALGCQLGDKEYKSGDDAMADVDVAAYSFALYEDFKDYGGPVCTVEIYGVPQALFKEKFGKKFNSNKLY